MQSYLINSSDTNFIQSRLDDFLKNLAVSVYNFHKILPAPSVGITEIRNVVSIVTRKSYDGGNRLIFIENFDKATLEASNSILKILEEPPAGTYIILSCTNINTLLPTITSRCQIINDNQTPHELDSKNHEKIIGIIKDIINSSAGKRLICAGNYAKTKDPALSLLNSMQITLEKCLNEDKPALPLSKIEITVLIRKISGAISYLDKNVNFKAVVDILFLGFPTINSYISQ